MTLLEVAIEADMNNGNLSKIERGLEEASIKTLAAIAGALGVKLEDLFRESPIEAHSTPSRLVPVVGEARLGPDGLYEASQYPEGGDGWIECKASPNAFALRCVGNSMRPNIVPRDYVVIEPDRKPAVGDIVAVRTDKQEQMIKVLAARVDGFIKLTSYNEAFPPKDYEEHEILQMVRVNNIYKPSDFLPKTDD
jgi:SOS-response transcriptional repressor LexA